MTKLHYYESLDIQNFLPCETPDAWVAKALKNLEILLIDHAHCEKKAASAAMSFMYRHNDKMDILMRMSKIAREELGHFEQVLAIMKKRGIEYRYLSASRYAEGLRKGLRETKQDKFIDALIIGAFVEARSCERFEKIAPHLDDELAKFYQGLLASEKRHFTIYLKFAQTYSETDISEQVENIVRLEKQLIETPDNEFRFHSGI
jgi:tRNA-(ms[2]io[6]A)-hydroxylase